MNLEKTTRGDPFGNVSDRVVKHQKIKAVLKGKKKKTQPMVDSRSARVLSFPGEKKTGCEFMRF